MNRGNYLVINLFIIARYVTEACTISVPLVL